MTKSVTLYSTFSVRCAGWLVKTQTIEFFNSFFFSSYVTVSRTSQPHSLKGSARIRREVHYFSWASCSCLCGGTIAESKRNSYNHEQGDSTIDTEHCHHHEEVSPRFVADMARHGRAVRPAQQFQSHRLLGSGRLWYARLKRNPSSANLVFNA